MPDLVLKSFISRFGLIAFIPFLFKCHKNLKNNTQSNYRLIAYCNLDSKLMLNVTPFNNGV